MSDSNESILRRHVITGARPGPHVLIVAGVHGDEFEPMIAVDRLRSAIYSTQLRGRITLVPVVNESAFARAMRTGDDGLDLARVCPGDPNGSVTLQAASAVSALIRSADFFIDLHTGGHGLTLFPLAGYVLHPDPSVLDVQRRMARAFNLPLVWGTSPLLNGRTLSVARDANIPAIYVEHGGGSFVTSRVDDLVAGCLNVLRELAALDGPAVVNRVEHFVEDPRDVSGHLQLNYPAPIGGLFQPSKILGNTVVTGDELGTVTDLLTDVRQSVTAVESGLLIMLRTSSKVAAGEPLAALARTEVPRG